MFWGGLVTDDKIITLPTGYQPEPDTDTATDLGWSLSLLHDELTQLSKAIHSLTKGLANMNNKLADIHRHIRKQKQD
jgi:prefoldin subunit 5